MDPGKKRTSVAASHQSHSKASQRSSKLSAKLSPPNIFTTFTGGKDPVKENLLQEALEKYLLEKALAEANRPKKPREKTVTPEMKVRVELKKPPEPIFPRQPYVIPESKEQKQAKIDRRLKAEIDRNFCKWDNIELPEPFDASVIGRTMDIPSPDVSLSGLKVFPRKPSVSPSQGIPEPTSNTQLELHKPKSGIFINETNARQKKEDIDSFDLVYERKPRPKRPDEKDEAKGEKRKKRRRSSQLGPDDTDDDVAGFSDTRRKKKKRKSKDNVTEGQKGAAGESAGDGGKDQAVRIGSVAKATEKSEEPEPGQEVDQEAMVAAYLEEEAKMLREEGESEDHGPDSYLTKMFRRKVSQASKATSLCSRDLDQFPVYDEADLEQQPYMTRIIQKFRRDSEAEKYKPPPRIVKRGTLESHSFTKLDQPQVKEFYFGLMMGSINQGDEHFGEITRGVQGICMSVAAYCYSMIVHPNKWTEFIVDDILEVGDKLYIHSIGNLHIHMEKKELEYNELHKYCFIDNNKVRFQVFEPEIVGLIRSGDRKVYNLSKGLQLFYQRHRAGILKTMGTNIAIWKDKYFYFFDAKGRKKDLIPDEKEGKAILANFYDVPSLATALLQNTNLGNWPFTISKLSVYKIMDKNAAEEDISSHPLERNDYNVVNENKAVIQGSFDLGDLCFDFSRNKQAIAMAAVCLVYSRITPPSAWHGMTVDKIMIIGNQLYLELVESENVLEMELERLPAVFTVGPYVVEILVYSYIHADVMFKKSNCILKKDLEKFFETNTMAIVNIGKFTLAVWKQRNMYYCFDPYSRNNEGLKCRNGNACVSMNSTIDSLVDTITTNFDNNDDIFYIHALKVLKIHRDPAQSELFPKNMTMDEFHPETFKEYKMKKSKKKAVEKRVTADFAESAVQKLLPWDFLGPSLIEVGSAVDSLTPEQIPPMVHKFPSRAVLKAGLPIKEKLIDLDSPSLSDTQIEPEKPAPVQGEKVIDMDAWELTQEEMEMQGDAEEAGGDEEGRKESYMAMDQFSQVGAESLESYHKKMSAQINTDITVGFLPVPRDILPPTNMRWKQKLKKEKEMARRREALLTEGELKAPDVTQSQELAKSSNFINLPDNTQLIRGTSNIAAYGDKLEYMAPFVCMMASAVAQKYALISWSPEIVDYTLKSGAKLYNLSRVRYDQVPILEVPKVSLGKSDYSILVQYLYDTIMKQRILEISLEKILFRKYECGLVVTPSYACAVFKKNHLYYMYDGFACNEVGLGEGPSNEGVACFARFKNIPDLVKRIIYNKCKRDAIEEYEYTRFVVSACTAKFIPPEQQKRARKSRKAGDSSAFETGEEEGESKKEEEVKPPEPTNKVGYQFNDGILTLQGSMALKGRKEIDYDEVKADHFVCVCACLMILNYPILRWDTKRVDYVIEQGQHIYSHAENLSISKQRIIRNILIHKHFFDIIVTTVEIPTWKQNKNFQTGVKTVINKHDYVIIQFPNCSYVIYRHNNFYHVFDPYPCLLNGKQDDSEGGYAGWTLFRNLTTVKKRIKSQIIEKGEHYIFYTFEVTAVRKAPKKVVLSQRLLEYDLDRPITPEQQGKPFHEKDYWLRKQPIPWSRIKVYSAKNKLRGKKENMWHNWDIEYPKDLYSLCSTIHQNSTQFAEKGRGKQTLANLITALGMIEIYNLSEWSAAIMDSVLVNGNNYFTQCIKDIKDDDHEFAIEDLQSECTIYPYKFDVFITPIVEGTMFLMRSNQFNLYKALRLFLDNYENRYGIICVTKGEETEKRFVAFGKVQELEYFMYDCQSQGRPMFLERQELAYIMRCKTLKRLLHVLIMTLRGGDFYIFEAIIDNFKAIN